MTDTANSNEFQAWLATLPAKGYDRDWIRRNMPALVARFEAMPSMPMPESPRPSLRPHDRYSEL